MRTYNPLSMIHAVRTGDVETVKDAIANNFNLEDGDLPDHSLLSLAAYSGNARMTQVLCDAGMDPNAENGKGQTPLHQTSNVETLKTLLRAGADPAHADHEGNTALHHVVRLTFDSAPTAVNVLLDHGAPIDAPNKQGETPLASAALHGSSTAAKRLMDRGADPHTAMACPAWADQCRIGQAVDDAMTLVEVRPIEQEKVALRQAAAEALRDQPKQAQPAARVRMRM